jgi:ABC-2 type transport system ATP-binding protein
MIEIENLSKTFGTKTAVDRLSLSVPPGAIFGFLGRNGAGKTTTLRMLMGLLQPSGGRAAIDGIDVTADPLAVRARVGYLPDEVFLYDFLTGQQFLEFVADVRGIPTGARESRIAEYLRFFELEEAAGDYTTNYSFGMKKKLALAAIVMHEPVASLLDEPFNGLDPQAVKNFRELLQRLAGTGVTVLFSSHVLEVVEKLVSHVGIIDRGLLRWSGPLPHLLEKYQGNLEKAFFALSDEELPQRPEAPTNGS